MRFLCVTRPFCDKCIWRFNYSPKKTGNMRFLSQSENLIKFLWHSCMTDESKIGLNLSSLRSRHCSFRKKATSKKIVFWCQVHRFFVSHTYRLVRLFWNVRYRRCLWRCNQGNKFLPNVKIQSTVIYTILSDNKLIQKEL